MCVRVFMISTLCPYCASLCHKVKVTVTGTGRVLVVAGPVESGAEHVCHGAARWLVEFLDYVLVAFIVVM